MEQVVHLNSHKDNELIRKCLSRNLIDSYGRESRRMVKISDLRNELILKN